MKSEWISCSADSMTLLEFVASEGLTTKPSESDPWYWSGNNWRGVTCSVKRFCFGFGLNHLVKSGSSSPPNKPRAGLEPLSSEVCFSSFALHFHVIADGSFEFQELGLVKVLLLNSAT